MTERTEIAAAVSSGHVGRLETERIVAKGVVQTVLASFGRSVEDNEMPGCSGWEQAWHSPLVPVIQ